MIIQSRRSLIVGMASLLAAPAIVRVSSLMPVKVIDNPDQLLLELWNRYLETLKIRFDNLANDIANDIMCGSNVSSTFLDFNNNLQIAPISLNDFLKEN